MTFRSKFRACALLMLGSACLAPLVAPAQAEGYLQPFVEGRNNLHRDIAGDELDAFATTLRESGRIVIDIEMENVAQCTSLNKRCLRFHLISAPNRDNRGWDIVGGVPKEAYSDRWRSNRDRGFRPTDIEALTKHVSNSGGQGGANEVYYAGLWIDNREKLAWASFTEIESSRFTQEFRRRVRDGSMVLVDHEASGFGNRQVAAIFVRPRAERRTSRWRPSQAEYAVDAPRIFAPEGGWPLYMRPGSQFDMTLRQDNVREARVFTALNNQQLVNRLSGARSDGFQLVDIERNGSKWLAVFLRRRAE
ncbi:MAG: hypothetical protein ABJP48_02450 [Erythrobacter sp.]